MRRTTRTILAGTLLLFCAALAASSFVGAAQRERLVVGYSMQMFVDIEAKDATSAMELWTRELCQKADLDGTSKLFDNDRELGAAIQQGRVDMATFSSLSYIQMETAIKGIPAYTGLRKGKKTIRYVLLGRTDLSAGGLAPMKGRILAFGREDEMAQLYLNTLLLRERLPEMKRHFSVIQVKPKPSQAIHAVYFGTADLCVVTEWAYLSMCELNPQIARKVKPVATSPELLQGFVIFRPGLSESVRQKATLFAKNMKMYPRGKQVLTLFQVDDLADAEDADLNATRELYREYRKLKGIRP